MTAFAEREFIFKTDVILFQVEVIDLTNDVVCL